MNGDHSWTEFAASYALDALDPEDRAAFESHLAGCPDCRAQVASYREVAGALALGAPALEAPAALRARVLAQARGVRPITSRQPLPAGDRRAWLATAAALVLALALGALYLAERSEHDDVLASSAEAHLKLAAAQERLAANDSMISALLAPDVQTAVLASEGRPPSARLFHNRERNLVVVTVFDLAPAAAGRTYQVWGIAGTQAVSIGTFNTQPNRSAVLTFRVPLGARYQVSAITDEPAGGSPQPTTRPFLSGGWSAP